VKKQSKTAQITKLIKAGDSVKDIVKKLKVTPTAVYQVRYRVAKEAAAKQKPVGIYTITPEPVQEVVQVFPDDPVNHPAHYKKGGIEVIDFIEAKRLGYHLGNVVKYISRAYHKGGMEDLLKAQWYLNRAIEKGEV
jgi:hypothetical protein